MRSSPQSTKIPRVEYALFSGRLLQTTALCGTHGPRASASAETVTGPRRTRQPGRRELRPPQEFRVAAYRKQCGALKKNTEYQHLANPLPKEELGPCLPSYPALRYTWRSGRNAAAAVNYRLAKRRRRRTGEGNGEWQLRHMMGRPVITW